MIEELVLRQHHVAVFVGDMERSIRFYQRCFGFRLCLTGYVEAAHERVAMLKLKDIVLELLSVDEWPTERLRTACLNTNTHFSIMVSDVAEARRRLEQDPELTFEEADIRRSQTSARWICLLPSCAARTANGSSCCRIGTTQSSDLRKTS